MRSALALLLAIAPPTLAFQNEPDGFRGIPWGAEASAYPDELVLETSERSMAMYARGTDKMAIGDAELTSIKYFFYKGRFHSVSINTKGAPNRRALINVMRVQFGQGVQPNQYVERHIWSGPTTMISLSCKPVVETCMLFMISTKSSKQRLADEKETGEKAKSDF
jgi:hypothetical protein